VSHVGAQEATYAGLGRRTLAFLVDSLVWLCFLVQIAALIPQETYDDAPVAVGAVFLVLLSAAFNYFWLTEWRWGQTIGKAVFSIRVTAEDGERLRFGPATLRNLLRVVDAVVIGPILIATSERRQRLGDRFAHTVVVRDRPVPVPAVANPNPHPMAPVPDPVSTSPATAVTAPAVGREVSPWRSAVGIPSGGWTPISVLWGILAAIGLLMIEALVVAAFDPELEGLGSKLAIQGLLAATLVAVGLAFSGFFSSPLSALRELGLRRFAASALGIAAVAYIAYIVFAAVYAALVQPEQDDVTRDLGFDEGGFGAIAAGVLIVAVAPVSEEVFFRGFMYGGLRRKLPMWAAALISGAVFGLLHYTDPDSIGVVPQLAVLGVLLAWLYERTGSLWPPIVLHVINNGIALAIVTST
jgi:uncharacterized protein